MFLFRSDKLGQLLRSEIHGIPEWIPGQAHYHTTAVICTPARSINLQRQKRESQ